MTDVAKLRDDHAELVRLARVLGAMIGQPSPPPQVELFDLRRKMASLLIAHLKLEDWVLYPRLMNSGDAIVSATGHRFNEEMGGLASAFANYNEHWSANAISADWAGYCRDSRVIIDALTDRITRENRELLPLLDQLDRAA